MTSLNIQQSTQQSENVSTITIEKLYNLALTSTVEDQNSSFSMSLQGNVSVPAAYGIQVQYLTTKFPNFHISANALYVMFQDPEVKRVLLTKNISSDGIGITETEATSVTGMPNWFLQNTDITTFNELKYFTNVNLSITFDGCSNLTSVDLSKVRQIQSRSFRNCAKLNIEVNAPLISGDLGWSAFEGSGITKVLNLGSCTSIEEYCFRTCTNLTEVTLPTSCTALGQNAFNRCVNLQTINVENIMYISSAVFSECTSISQIFYFKELLEQNHNKSRNSIFTGGSPYIYAPKLQSLGGGYDKGGNDCRGAFITSGWNGTRSNKKIVYFRDLSSVETGAFCGGVVKHLIINNSTIPTVTAHVDQNQDLLIDVSGNGVSNSVVQNVWVPDSAVNSYKQHQYWGEFGNRIRGLSGMNKVATKELWDQLSDSAKEDTLIEAYM